MDEDQWSSVGQHGHHQRGRLGDLTANTYFVLISGLEYSNRVHDFGDLPHPPEWTKINGQTLANTGITNQDGSVMGPMVVSAVGGTTVTLTPTFTQFYTNPAVSISDTQVINLRDKIMVFTVVFSVFPFPIYLS